jgi:glycosyltransferase involved in cell wall biosynthesis
MLTSRPCLATGPEGVTDLIRPEFGAIVDPSDDPIALNAVLRSYMDDPALRERQGKAARAWAESVFARPVVAKLIEELIARAQAAA